MNDFSTFTLFNVFNGANFIELHSNTDVSICANMCVTEVLSCGSEVPGAMCQRLGH